ncbi:sensor histidine kinase [Motilibacter deserti]|uniref:histidine kinase n=1 Tax=Motilibacter deserti TaxID=2714956 RepID=A0ABX0H2H6_9ACTN|nr:histidine kinase [Motilibacter deserti]NHC16004.1 sensor histidine kinase [Motilibacter deserti]
MSAETVPSARRAALPARRQRLLLLAAALGLASVGALVALAVRALSDTGPGATEAVLAVVALVPALLAAADGPRVRRSAGPVLTAAAALGAVGATVLIALGVVLLVLGRLPADEERRLVLPVALGTAAASAAAVPLVRRTTRAAARALLGVRRSPDEVLRAFGDRATSGAPVEELLDQLATSLRRTLSLDVVEVWTGDGTRLERTLRLPDDGRSVPPLEAPELALLARAGVAGEAWLRLWIPHLLDGRQDDQLRLTPALHAGSVLGLVVAGRSAQAARLGEAEERVLADVGRRLGVVLRNRVLDSALRTTLEDLRDANTDLRRSRARLVSAADAERRRIERDLHDGAQQHLVALAVTLGLAKDLVTEDPAAAVELLEEAAADARATVQQVRDLAHGIYPPLLVEAGLAQALPAAAARARQPVTVHASVGRYAAGVEEAVYFCCLEALQNAAKHAPAAPVTLRVWEEQGELCFEVRDEGPGFDAATVRPGSGFENMADRLGAIGGRVTWTSALGEGTCVSGRVRPALQAA